MDTNEHKFLGRDGNYMTNGMIADEAASFTVEKFFKLLESVPKGPFFNWCVCRPDAWSYVKAKLPKGDYDPIGIEVFTMNHQKARGWMFSDRKLLADYLEGKVSEDDLKGLVGSGKCKVLDQ